MLGEVRKVAQRLVQVPPAIWIAKATHSNGMENFMWGTFTQTSYTVAEHVSGNHSENRYRALCSKIVEYLKETGYENNYHIMCYPPDMIGNIICLNGSLTLLQPLSDTMVIEFWQAFRNQYRTVFPIQQS